MKKAVVSILLVFMTLVTSILSYADTPQETDVKKLSLEAAIQEGIKNSSQLKISDLDIQVKEVELSEARYDEKKYKDSDYSLGTVQGFQLDANMLSKKAEYALEEEKIKKDYIAEDTEYNVTRAYYGALQARDYAAVVSSNLENIQRNRDIVKKKFDLGIASKSDLLMAEIALDEAKVNVEKAKEDVEKSLRALNMTLNYPLDTKLALTSNFKEESFTADLSNDVEKAYKDRFDMIQLNHNYDLVKLDFDTNSIMYPENTYVYKYKKSSIAKMEQLLHNSKQNVEFDIRNKYDAIVSAKKQIELSKANVERAKEGLRLRELSYNAGMGTLLEVKESANQLYSAEVNLSNSVSSYNLAILEYNKAVNIGTVQ